MTVQLTDNAHKVLQSRYLRRNAAGRVVETPDELFQRVARGVAGGEERFGGSAAVSRWEATYYELLSELEFLPNSPTLLNAGTPLGQLSACFVLPVEDSMAGIFDSLKLMALIQQSGGGTGFSFSRLRPQGDLVASTGGQASGPVSFMRIFDCATENIRQGGKRRGANMGILRVDHPDIERFIAAKQDGQTANGGRCFQNFNLSVGATDEFMEAVEGARPFELRHPRTGETVRSVAAAELFEQIAQAAWETGDPGLVFLDAINRTQPTPVLGPIEATNPCGEVPLLPYESCNLGSINLSRMVRVEGTAHTVDWDKLAQTVHVAVRFLDDVIEQGRWPDERIAAAVRGNRKIGLGVMGFAELLMMLEIAYASDQAVSLAEALMQFIGEHATEASQQLAEERGVFPNWERSIDAAENLRVRNATRTSIAPTGTIGIIAGTSAGIEPLFALAYRREHVLEEQRLTELNPIFLRHARAKGFYSEDLLDELQNTGSLAALPNVPDEAKTLFRTALEIAPEEHLQIQAAFQKYVDNAVSKTINLPESASPEVIGNVYRRAWQLGLKGITVYRYGSKSRQVLSLGVGEQPEQHEHFSKCDPHACKL